jgi:hypothetical protein
MLCDAVLRIRASTPICALLLHLLLALPLAGAAQAPPEPEPAAGTPLRIEIETPLDGALIGDPAGLAFVAGNALAHSGELEQFDIVFVIDQSQSTLSPSGGDVNGDGRSEGWSCDGVHPVLGVFGAPLGLCALSPDSVLAAELNAVRTLVGQLDPRTTRIGVVSFDGDSQPRTSDAHVLCPLTAEYAHVRSALDEIEASGPRGLTNFRDAIELGAHVLSSLHETRPEAQRILIFLSDGQPTAPYEQSIHQNRRLAVEAALSAARSGLRIDAYAIGAEALSNPVVLVEMSRVSGGIFTPVQRPSDLQSIFEQVDFSEIEALSVRNLTTAAEAQYVAQRSDGGFAGLLEMAPGSNVIEVYARSSDGSEATRRLRVQFAADGPPQPLSPHWVSERNRLLENQLADLRRRNLQVEAQRDSELRRSLELEIDEKRARAERERERRVRVGVGQPDEKP